MGSSESRSDAAATEPRLARAYQRSRQLLAGVVVLTEGEADDDLRRQLRRSAVAATIGCVDARTAPDAQDARRRLEEALGAAREVTRMSSAVDAIGRLARRSESEIEAALSSAPPGDRV